MEFKHKLPEHLIAKAVTFDEFANGGSQATLRLRSGKEIGGVLISNGTFIIAIQGFSDLPFPMGEVVDLYQSEIDRTSPRRSGWTLFK